MYYFKDYFKNNPTGYHKSKLYEAIAKIGQLREKTISDCLILVISKYDFEKEYKPHLEMAVIHRCIEWVNDWYEGQENVEYIGVIPIDELEDELIKNIEEYGIEVNNDEQ